jgi:hypothetical protein
MMHCVIYYPIFCLLLIDKARAKDLLPWDIELVIDESIDEKEEEPEAQVQGWIVVTQTYLIC